MSLKYGLNLKKASGPPIRRAVFDDEDGDDDDVDDNLPPERAPKLSKLKSRLSGPPRSLKAQSGEDEGIEQNLASLEAAQARVKEAEEIDPSIFDYDSFHDAKTIVNEAKKEIARKEAIERKPKYIDNLLDAAARRKQDQLVAREKFLQKEREAEGDEFADKETFVTGAYKEQQEEARRVQEEEELRAAEDARRKRQMGGGMQSFYRNMMDDAEKKHQETLDAAAKLEREGGIRDITEEKRKTNAQLVEELRAKGVNVQVNEEGEIADKRQLLSAGLNVVASGRSEAQRAADKARGAQKSTHPALSRQAIGDQQGSRERQTRMIEEQLAAQAKRAREEEVEEQARLERAAKSTKTEESVNDAKARYLARKAAKAKQSG